MSASATPGSPAARLGMKFGRVEPTTPGVAATARSIAGELGLLRRPRDLGDELQRSVVARTEALGEQVVGLPRGRARGIRAGVGRSQSHRQERDREQHEHAGGDRGEHRWPLLHPAGPPGPAGRLVARAEPAFGELAALAAAQHARAEEPEQGRQQRQRGDDRERDRDRGRDRDAVQEADAEREHPEHRDAHDHPREQHRPARGVDRLDHGFLAAQPSQQALPIPGDDEQRVVDADPEPDQQRQLVAERRHLDHVGQQADHGDAGPERQAGGHERQRHRQQRAEHEEQDDAGGEDPEREAAGHLAGLPPGRPVPRPRPRRRCPTAARAALTKFLAAVGVILLDWTSNVTFANATWPEGEICSAPRGPYGEATAETCGWRLSESSIGLHLRADRRVGHPAVIDRDHDLLGVARGSRGDALEQVDRVEALGPGQPEVVAVGASDGGVERGESDQRDHPAEHREPPVREAPPGKTSHCRQPPVS